MIERLVSTPSSDVGRSVLSTARAAAAAGISVIPIRADGTKRPAIPTWREYQDRCANTAEIERWFLAAGVGIAFVAGVASGNLELLDFDARDIYQAWRDRMKQEGLGALVERIARGYLEQTPKGMHLWYRCREIEGNQPLARIPCPSHGFKTLIETRGLGGYGIGAPSGGQVHPSGEPYRVLEGSITTILTITVLERQKLFAVARTFNEVREAKARSPISDHPAFHDPGPLDGDLPGHIFNRQASWEEVLVPHGWRLLKVEDGEGYWTKNLDPHATTNYRGNGLFYVFSTTTKFDPGVGYSKFAAYTLLNYGSTSPEAFRAATRDLAKKGYQ
jgi:hypothetical protein